MNFKNVTHDWFDKWKKGDFLHLPITEDFIHISPFGTITGKEAYLQLVIDNKDKFLGYDFIIHDEIYDEHKACIQYTAIQGDFKLEVSEWHYFKNQLIHKVIAHYHIGEIREDRKLS